MSDINADFSTKRVLNERVFSFLIGMRIYLLKHSFFTFRGKKSYDLDLLGKTTLERMRKNLGAEIVDEVPAGEKLVLFPAFPFLTRPELESYVLKHDGNFSFLGGYCERETGVSARVDAPDTLHFFSLADYPVCLAAAQKQNAERFLKNGALVEEGAIVGSDVFLGAGAVVERGARVMGRSVIGRNAVIGSGSEVTDSFVGEKTVVRHSVLEGVRVGKHCTVGPFAYLRAGSVVSDGCRIGDFVELKNARLGSGTKAAHLAYIGDAELGKDVNVGCGVVFANYNGKIKQKTKIGDGTFLGSNCNLVAPLEIGNRVYVAAGTTVTKDLKNGDFCIGRCRETIKEDYGEQYLK